MRKFEDFLIENENTVLNQVVKIKADPPMKMPDSLKKLGEAFKTSNEVELDVKEIDPNGEEKPIRLKKKTLYIVGGAVRDFLLNKTPRGGYDLVTDAHPTEVAKIAKANGFQFVPQKDHVIIRVDNDRYVVNTFRRTSSDKDSIFGNMEEDAKTRDFTVNALYYDVSGNMVLDPLGGLSDIKNKKISFIDNPKKKLEKDPVSGLRYLRFNSTINPDGGSDPDIEEEIKKNDLDRANPGVVNSEFAKAISHPDCNCNKFVSSLQKTNQLKHITDLNFDTDNNKPVNDKKLMVAYMLRKNDPSMLADKAKNIGFERDAKDIAFLIDLANFKPENLMKLKQYQLTSGLTRRKIREWAELIGLSPEFIDNFLDIQISATPRDSF